MALHGSVGEFNPAREDWNTYIERLKFYFEANGVEAAAKKCAIFLSSSGAETFKLVCSLAAPTNPRELSFAQLVDLLNEHYNPKKAAAVQRYKFNSRIRQPGESIATYVAELKKLAVHCGFEEDTIKQMLCNRLVCGINDPRMQRRLLTEPELNFDKALALTQALESADQSTADLEKTHTASPSTGSSIYRVPLTNPPRNPKKQTQPGQCYHCGGKHYASDCRFRNADCRFCGKKGHIARVCRTRLRVQTKRTAAKSQGTHQLSGSSQPQTPSAEYSLFQLSERRNDPIMVTVTINNKELPMEVDTGAAFSVISENTYLSTWAADDRPPLRPSTVSLNTYSGELLVVCGSINVPVVYKQQRKQLSMQVLKFEGPTLLGCDWLKQLILDWKQLNTISQQSNQHLQRILDDHAEIFKKELGSLRGVKVQIHVKPQALPRYYRLRPVPYSLRQKVENEHPEVTGPRRD